MGDKEKKDEEKEPKGEKKAEGGEKKEKKEKAPKEVKKVHVKSAKANPNAPIDPRTGTRFAPDSARQLAFEIVLKGAKENKNIKEIRGVLENTRKDKGAPFNLDIGYVNFVVASHPDFFEAYNDGSIKILKEPTIDAEAAKKFEQERTAKKEKAAAAREERKKAKEGEKAEKAEKKEKKDEEKPSKKEKVAS